MKHYCIYAATMLQIFFLHRATLAQENTQKKFENQHFDSTKTLNSVLIESSVLNAFKSEIRVSNERIFKEAKVSFVSALENIAGLAAIQTGVGIAKPVIRGMSFNRLVVSENGIKQQGQQWGSDHGLEVDALGVESIKITKGPLALAYGSDAIAGAIEIESESVKEQGLLIENTSAYQSNNRLFANSLAIISRRSKFFAKARATWQSFGDFRVPAKQFVYNGFVLPIYEQRLKNTAGRELNYRLSMGWIGEKIQTSLLWSSFNQQAGIFGGAIGSPRFYELSLDDSRNIDIPRQVNHHNKLVFNILKMKNQHSLSLDLGWQNNLRSEQSVPHAHGRQIDPSNTLALQMNLTVLSVNLKLEKDWNALALTLGSTAEFQQNRSSGFEFLIPDYQSFQTGFFALAERNIKPKLKTTAGVRFDAAQFVSPLYRDGFYEELTDESFRSGETNRNFSNLSAAWGLSWSPVKKFNAKLNLSRVFRFPTVNELVSNGIHHGVFRHEKGNPSLSPEVGYCGDAAVDWLSKNLKISFSPYAYFFENYLYLRPSARFSPLPEAGQVYQFQQDKATLVGFEAEAEYKIFKPLIVSAFYTLIRAKNLSTAFGLPFTPADKCYSRLSYRFKINTLKVDLFSDFAYYFAQFRTDRNERATPDYKLWGAGIELTHKSNSLIISAQNLTNSPYLNHLSRYRLLSIPEPGRNVRISLKVPLFSRNF